jgi:hypothetical protein
VHRRDIRLTRFTLADAVRARLGKQERLVTGETLNAQMSKNEISRNSVGGKLTYVNRLAGDPALAAW